MDFFGPLKYQIKYKFSKNIEKKPYKRVEQKRYNFAPGAANNTCFDSPCIKTHSTIFLRLAGVYQCIHNLYCEESVKLI